MAQLSNEDVRQLFLLAHDNKAIGVLCDTFEAIAALVRSVEPLTVEVTRLRNQVAIDAQYQANTQAQLRHQEGELNVLRAQLEGLQARVAAA
jgi:hypothetical protein